MPNPDFKTIMHELVVTPEATQAMSVAGGAHVAVTAADLHARNTEMLKFLDFDFLKSTQPPPKPPPPPPLPDQIGPLTQSPIVLGGGVPVGGWSQLTLYRNGAFNYSGHFHDSGATSYNMSCVYAIRGVDGTIFTFSHRGRVHGTFEAGSRDDDWSNSGTNEALAAAWPSLVASLSWQVRVGANLDFSGVLDQAVQAVGTVVAVVAVL